LGLGEWLKSKTPIELGNLDASRDWGHAQDYVEAMWLMLQRPEPQDFVIGTGVTHSIREFIEMALMTLGCSPISWEGQGAEEVCRVGRDIVVKINPEFYRPAEVDLLIADPTKSREILGWVPKISFRELVKRMVYQDTQ
jgi:GDPmannose 4,6-dehydratase